MNDTTTKPTLTIEIPTSMALNLYSMSRNYQSEYEYSATAAYASGETDQRDTSYMAEYALGLLEAAEDCVVAYYGESETDE